MNKEAIERIKGFCCEVTQEQWEELVMVAHDNGVNPSDWDEWDECYPVFFIDAQTNSVDAYGSVDSAKKRLTGLIPIPFTDFLAKLKGEEKWQPKAGEMVEVNKRLMGMKEDVWVQVKFIGYNDAAYVWFDPLSRPTYGEAKRVRPLRPTITRTEAEQLLNKRIID